MHLDAATLKTLGAGFVNLGIFLAIIYRVGKQPFVDFVKNRSLQLREQVQDAKVQLEKAQAQYSEFQARLASIDSEVSALRSQNHQDVQAVSTRVREDSGRQALQIVAEAKLARDAAVDAARKRLALDVGQMVIDRAEAIIKSRMTGDEKARIRREFSNQLEQVR